MDELLQLPCNAVRQPPLYYFIENPRSGLVLGIKKKDQNIKAELEVQEKEDPQGDCHQHWFLEKAGSDGQLHIFSQLNCLVVDIHENEDQCGTPVIMYYRKSCPLALANQKWRFLKGGYIQSVMNNQVLEIAGGGAEAGQSVVTWTKRAPPGNESQLWDLKPVDASQRPAELETSSSEDGNTDSGILVTNANKMP